MSNNPTATSRPINVLPNLGMSSDGKKPIINKYNFIITDYKISINKNNFTEALEPQLVLEVINLDSGYRIETTKGKPVRIDGDVAIGQKYILRGVSLARSYYEPKKSEWSKYQEFVNAVTGGITIADAKKIFEEGFLAGKQFTAEIDVRTSEKGNQYQQIVSYGSSDELDMPAEFDETPLLEELSEVYSDWDLDKFPLESLWRKAEIPTTEVAYFSVFSDNIRTALSDKGFSMKPLDPNRKDDKGQDKPIKWITYLKEDEHGTFIKTRQVNGKTEKEVIDGQAAFDYANSLGLVSVSEADLIAFLEITDISQHYDFLKSWVNEKMPAAVEAGYVKVGRDSGSSKVGLKKLVTSSPAQPKVVPTQQVDSEGGFDAMPDIDFDGIVDPFSN